MFKCLRLYLTELQTHKEIENIKTVIAVKLAIIFLTFF